MDDSEEEQDAKWKTLEKRYADLMQNLGSAKHFESIRSHITALENLIKTQSPRQSANRKIRMQVGERLRSLLQVVAEQTGPQ